MLQRAKCSAALSPDSFVPLKVTHWYGEYPGYIRDKPNKLVLFLGNVAVFQGWSWSGPSCPAGGWREAEGLERSEAGWWKDAWTPLCLQEGCRGGRA